MENLFSKEAHVELYIVIVCVSPHRETNIVLFLSMTVTIRTYLTEQMGEYEWIWFQNSSLINVYFGTFSRCVFINNRLSI